MYIEKKLDVKTNIIWNSIGNIVYWGCSWLITILVVRLGNYELAGVLSVAMSVSSTIYCISAYGMYNYQVSDLENQYSSDCYMTSRLITASVGVIISLVICIVCKYDFFQAFCVVLYMLYKTIESFINVVQAEEQKAGRMDLIGISYIIRGLGSLVVFVICMSITKNLLITLAIMVLLTVSILLFYDIPMVQSILKRCYKLDWNNVQRLLISCLPMALYWMFNTLTPTVPKLEIERNLGQEALGYYASISSPLLVITMGANFILTPLISPLAKFYIQKDFRKLRNMIIQIFLSMLLVGFIVFEVVKQCVPFVLSMLYGKEILAYLDIAYEMIVVLVLSSVISFLNMLYTIFRKLWYLVFVNGVVALACFPICDWLILENGMQGANMALFILYGTQIIIMGLMFTVLLKRWRHEKLYI